MIVLGIDTSTARSSVAVLTVPDGPDGHGGGDGRDARAIDDVRVLASAAHEDARGHGAFLAPALAGCLAEAGLGVADVGGVAVGTGPGLYTGLRIGMATATALAWARGVPVVGVAGPDAVALAARRDPALADVPLVVVLDARRGQWFHASYAADPSGRDAVPRRAAGPDVGDVDAVRAALGVAGPRARAVGEVPAALADVGTGGRSDGAVRPDAADVARLAVPGLRRGGTDPTTLTPSYLRDADVRIGWAERGGGRAVGA